MSTPDFEVHRAIVHYSNPSTGAAQVRVPSLLGAEQVVDIPTTGLTNSDGYWNVPSIGSSTFIAVSVDRTQFLWLTAIGISGSGGDDPSNEPIGHEDRTTSYMEFNNSTRTFTIQPLDSSYVVWCVGQRYEKYGAESVTIPDVEDLYYIYFDPQGELQYRTSYFQWDEDCPTAYIYWNGTEGFLFDERHGITLDWQTHEYLHRTRGAAIANGLLVSEYGSTDESIEVADGTFFDEDLQVDIRHSLTPDTNTWEQQLQGPARIPVMYRSGTTWVKDTATDYPFKLGTTYPVYNTQSGGNWSTTEFAQNGHGIMWIVATNMLESPVLSLMGQQLYTNVDNAREQTWEGMDFEGLPIVEMRVLAKIIFLTNGTSANANIEILEISDYRRAMSDATSSASAVVSHSDLTDLSADDHPQYAFRNSSPTITLAGDATGSVTLTNLSSGTLTVSVANDSHTHDDRYYQRDGTYTTSDILSFQSNDNMRTSSGSQAALQVYQDTANADAFMTFHVSGDYAVYFGLDGGINDLAVGGWSMGNTAYRIWHQGNDGSGSGLDADLLDGLQLHTGRNNEANKVVRTDSNGYIQAGWINTTSGATTSTISRIYASNDAYVRYVTPATFRSQVTDGVYEPVHSHPYIGTSSTQSSHLYIRNSSPTVYLRDSNNRSSMMHCNSNFWYLLRGSGNDSTTWTAHNGIWPFVVYLEDNEARFGGQVTVINMAGTGSYNTVRFNTTSGQLMQFTSLAEFKTDVVDINGVLGALNERSLLHDLRPVLFHENQETVTTRGEYIPGFIAEEVHEVAPELTYYDKNGDLISYSPEALVPHLVAEIQRLNGLVESLYQDAHPDWVPPQPRPSERGAPEKVIFDAGAAYAVANPVVTPDPEI